MESRNRSAQEVMEHDSWLLAHIKEPLLHLYSFPSPSVTYGYFLDPDQLFHRAEVARRGLDLARRPTGGGVIFHEVDFTFSFLIPATHPRFSLNPLDNYLFINSLVKEIVEETFPIKIELFSNQAKGSKASESFCMAHPTKYDLLVGGKKMGGAAQRNNRKAGFLHQGSLLLGQLDCTYLASIIKESSVVEALENQSFAILGCAWSLQELEHLRARLRSNFIKRIENYA